MSFAVSVFNASLLPRIARHCQVRCSTVVVHFPCAAAFTIVAVADRSRRNRRQIDLAIVSQIIIAHRPGKNAWKTERHQASVKIER